LETATAGWAAGLLAGVAMYFRTRSAQSTDRRVVLAGPAAGRRPDHHRPDPGRPRFGRRASRPGNRTGIDEPGRVITGTLSSR
jgi:hypothetical protein